MILDLPIDQSVVKVMMMAKKNSVFFSKGHAPTQNLII